VQRLKWGRLDVLEIAIRFSQQRSLGLQAWQALVDPP